MASSKATIRQEKGSSNTKGRLRKVHRVLKRKKPLSELSVDEVMDGDAEVSDDDERGNEDTDVQAPTAGKKKAPSSGHRNAMTRLAETDPEFFQYLAENDQQLLEFSGDEGAGEEIDDSEDDGMGRPEPVPTSVTSRSEKQRDSELEQEEGEEDGDQDKEGGRMMSLSTSGKAVTLKMVNKWVAKVTKTHSLSAWKMLVQALQAAVGTIGDLQSDGNKSAPPPTLVYRVEGTKEFNAIVGACLKYTHECLSHHIEINHRPGKRPSLPSTHRAWPMVKKTLRLYLPTVTKLLQNLHESSMQRAILRHIHTLAPYFACFPKTERSLKGTLVTLWSTGEEHVQVLAFLTIRALTLLHPHPALHLTLKKLYLSFVRNCKFTLPSTQPRIRFMQNCLVELLSIDPPTAYQHAFVYVRQLAVHLRNAYASPQKDSQQAVYNWQFVHCLDLWAMLLGQRGEEESLRPLLYPLIQTAVGTLSLQPSPKYYPLRLHCVRTLLELSGATGTYVPLAPYLLEIMEAQATTKTSATNAGKPPELANLLRLSKMQLQSRALQSNLLNESFELMVQLLANHSFHIGFPELAFPILVRLKKVAKVTSLSWFRMQLKQLVEKTEEVSGDVTRDRATVSFSPKDSDQIAAWEKDRKTKENAVVRFLNTWKKVHRQEGEEEEEGGQRRTIRPLVAKKVATKKGHQEASDEESSEEDMEEEGNSTDLGSKEEGLNGGEEDEEDVVEDLQLSSDMESC